MTISKKPMPWARCNFKTRLARWQNVLRVLNGLTPEQRQLEWDMSEFGTKTECGTHACAAGHCAMDPWFKERGMRLRWHTLDTPKARRQKHPIMWARLSMEAYVFWGRDGADEIFYNPTRRSVEQVIFEVGNYIEVLKFEHSRDKRNVPALSEWRLKEAILKGLPSIMRSKGAVHART